MNPIASILRDYPLIVLDGALATELEQRGCDLRDPLWSAKVLLEAPVVDEHHIWRCAAGEAGRQPLPVFTFAGNVLQADVNLRMLCLEGGHQGLVSSQFGGVAGHHEGNYVLICAGTAAEPQERKHGQQKDNRVAFHGF